MSQEELDELEKQLDPAIRYAFRFLRETIERLEESLRVQGEALRERDQKLAELVEHLQYLERKRYGRNSEKMPPIARELARRSEPTETLEGAPLPEEPLARKQEKLRIYRKKSEVARAERRAARNELPVVLQEVSVTEEQLPKGMRLEEFRELQDNGGNTIDRLVFVPSYLEIHRYHLQTLVAKNDPERVIKAKAPAAVVEGSHFDASVYAQVVVSRCADTMPFYRQSKVLERAGYPLGRSTIGNLFHGAATLLMPVYQELQRQVRSSELVHGDETTQPVLAREKCEKGWIWVILSSQGILYRFSTSREKTNATELLEDSEGYLVVDGYQGYDELLRKKKRKRVGCWAHTRRKFFESGEHPVAQEFLGYILQLYEQEWLIIQAGLSGTAAHREARQTKSREIVKKIYQRSQELAGTESPSSKIGKALTYLENQEQALSAFLEDTRLPLDNNIAERALRIIALGRKNSLFSGSPDCAQNLAILQSLVSTCALFEVNPFEYLKDILPRLQSHPQARIAELLPQNWLLRRS